MHCCILHFLHSWLKDILYPEQMNKKLQETNFTQNFPKISGCFWSPQTLWIQKREDRGGSLAAAALDALPQGPAAAAGGLQRGLGELGEDHEGGAPAVGSCPWRRRLEFPEVGWNGQFEKSWKKCPRVGCIIVELDETLGK